MSSVSFIQLGSCSIYLVLRIFCIGPPAKEEGEVPGSELDPDTRASHIKHDQHITDFTPPRPLPTGPPVQISVPPEQSYQSWFPIEPQLCFV